MQKGNHHMTADNRRSSRLPFPSIPAAASVLFCLALSFEPIGVCAQGQTQINLPPGYYQYLGQNPGASTARNFFVDADGRIHWDSNTADGDASSSSTQSQSTPLVKAADEYNYPLIKWKGRRLLGTAKANGWLTTTYENGAVKYQIHLEAESGILKSEAATAAKKRGLTIELLDKEDFKITELLIPGSALHEEHNASELEAKGIIPMPEELYRKTRNITIR